MTDDLSFTLEDSRYRQLSNDPYATGTKWRSFSIAERKSGIGYIWDYGLNYWFRRALFDAAWLGSPAEHRARAAVLADW